MHASPTLQLQRIEHGAPATYITKHLLLINYIQSLLVISAIHKNQTI